MIKPPDVVSRELRYPKGVIWILLGAVLLVRLALIPVNVGEYTDGVLQARQFTHPVGIWPPLYSGLVYLSKFIFDYLYGGRLISAVASSLAIIPIFLMTRRAFGTRAALYAGIFYIVAPVANRWGVRLMTDATFSLFFFWCAERLYFASDERDKVLAFKALGWACVAAVLGTLTRYQGLMLFPLVGICAFMLWRRFDAIPWKPLLWCAGLVILPIWESLIVDGFIHDEQFSDRSLGRSTEEMLRIIALNGEAFLLYLPYFLTYPVAVMTFMGIFWARMRRGFFFALMVVYTLGVLIVVQSAFSSFQERYFLPLFGFLWVLAGAGLFSMQERWFRDRHPWAKRAFPYVMIFIFGYSAIFSAAVQIAQRESWGDLVQASRFVGKVAPEDAKIFSNEVYKVLPSRVIAGDKVEFFSGRDGVIYLSSDYIPPTLQGEPLRDIPPGSYVVLSSIYGGDFHEDYLRRYYRMSLARDPDDLEANPFMASIMPLLPDNTPGHDQSPTAWFQRYTLINFESKVFVIESRR